MVRAAKRVRQEAKVRALAKLGLARHFQRKQVHRCGKVVARGADIGE